MAAGQTLGQLQRTLLQQRHRHRAGWAVDLERDRLAKAFPTHGSAFGHAANLRRTAARSGDEPIDTEQPAYFGIREPITALHFT